MPKDLKQPIILWFRQDLRLEDNPALVAACQSGRPIVPLYILDETNPGKWGLGGASRWWLHHSLCSLNTALYQRGSQLFLLRGDPLEILPKLVQKYDAAAVYWNRCYEPYAIKRDRKLKSILPFSESFKGSLLFEPWEVLNRDGEFFKVFTPFWRRALEIAAIAPPLERPEQIPTHKVESEPLESWKLLPRHPDWAAAFGSHWHVGESAALSKLKQFLDRGLERYAELRDAPGIDATSSLSPHLHFGEISPRQIFHAVKSLPSSTKFLSELGWREFAHYQLYHFPQLPERPWRAEFADFPWEKNTNFLKKWQQGETGYPIVDAGMRQLWTIGWMHNRVRMITASFLIKDLMIRWQEGEAWFWDTLVDADLASNAASWQWVAGSGFDAAPFFRIFNPVLQGEKFDPEGLYVKQWVPELTDLPKEFIHKPWRTTKNFNPLYPSPIVDHQMARLQALAGFKKIKAGS